jgi:superfamily II DNA or RNA helicase
VSLFPIWSGTVQLPATPERRVTVGDNCVVQHVFLGTTTTAQIFDSQHKGHDTLKTTLSHPYDQVLIRRPGARRVDSPQPVVTALTDGAYTDAELPLEFKWGTLGDIAEFANTPSKVLDNWKNRFSFVLEDGNGTPGLRLPQLGALHAIAAHFAVGKKFEPATIVLPTGTGKTETMLATQVYRQLPKTLVIVPSDQLRGQVSRKVMTLGTLPSIGALPIDIARPFVCKLAKGVQSTAEASAILEIANVIVATPDILRASEPAARERLISGCTDLMVDEAHHVTAASWNTIKEQFLNKRIIQFTATPFRRDERKVDGKIIFNFSLGDAQEAGYYRPINLKTIEEYGDQETRDERIAQEALTALRRDRNDKKLDHLLMARTATKERAGVLWQLYNRLGPEFKPVVVYSGPGQARHSKRALAQLLDRGENGSHVAVCVNMLGEGFDLPNLKIVALHDTHKSLAVTLQFIGRFTRRGEDTRIGEATVVTNIADPEAETKIAALYAEGADWDKIIKRLSDERIAEELRLQDIVGALRRRGTLHAQLSLWNLRPALSTQMFRTSCKSWDPLNYTRVLSADVRTWYALDEDGNLLVAVVHQQSAVSWGNYQNLEVTSYDLLIVRWDKQNNVLFIHSSDFDGLRTEKIAKEITGATAVLLNGSQIFQILNNVELPLAKSLGSSRVGAISFTSYFGSNVTEGLASIEKSESELNHIACLGYEDGDRVLWGGAKRKGKVWQHKSGTISQWIDWCDRTWKKVSSEETVSPNITRDFLRPIRLQAPHPSPPIAVEWGEHAQMGYSERQFIHFGSDRVPLYLVELQIRAENDGSAVILLLGEDTEASYRFTISSTLEGGYRHERVFGPEVQFEKANGVVYPLAEHLIVDPFIVRYADGTHSYNCYHIPVSLEAGMFPASRLESWQWNGVPLNRESMGKTRARDTIQFRTFENIEGEYDLVFNDDGCGEAADLVALRDVDESTIGMCLVHCKNAHGGKVSADIRNFYTLCGQAQKSVTIKHRGLPRLYHDLKHRHDLWQKQGHSRFLKGDMRKLSYFKDKSRRARLELEVVLVQPGASVAGINPDALKLLATTELFLKKTAAADLRVIMSE